MRWRSASILLVAAAAGAGVSWGIWGKGFRARWPGAMPGDATALQRRFGGEADPNVAAKLDKRLPKPFRVEGVARTEIQRTANEVGVRLYMSRYEHWLEASAQKVRMDVGGLRLEEAILKIAHRVKPEGQFAFVVDKYPVIDFGDIRDVNPARTSPRTQGYPLGALVDPAAKGDATRFLTDAIWGFEPELTTSRPSSIRLPSVVPFNTGSEFGLLVTGGTLFQRDVERLIVSARQREAVRWLGVRLAGTSGGSLAAGTGVVLVLRWRERVRARRVGLCVGCGYDMRASPERCPECGRVWLGKKVAT